MCNQSVNFILLCQTEWPVTMNIGTFLIDFEASMLSAVRKEFPETQITGCHFHLAQSWLWKIQNLGLLKSYRMKESHVGKLLRHSFSLPGLDHNMVTECFAEFSSGASSEAKPFGTYLKENYMQPNSLFPPHLWAGVLWNDAPTTTNACIPQAFRWYVRNIEFQSEHFHFHGKPKSVAQTITN